MVYGPCPLLTPVSGAEASRAMCRDGQWAQSPPVALPSLHTWPAYTSATITTRSLLLCNVCWVVPPRVQRTGFQVWPIPKSVVLSTPELSCLIVDLGHEQLAKELLDAWKISSEFVGGT